jgi:N-ethylmaleimide reductase
MVYVAGGTAMTGTPREMTGADIRQAIADFRNAAQIAVDAGFDGIQLQAGFLYLIQQFMLELTNLRTDEYGGSLENRTRFLFAVLEAELEIWPSNRVGVKTGLTMTKRGLFTAVDSTLPTFEYVYDKLNAYDLSHVFLMRQMADLSAAPIAALAGDTLEWSMPGGRGDAGKGDAPNAPADMGGSTIFEAMSQIGLRLEQRKRPVSVIVIDHVERVPTAN